MVEKFKQLVDALKDEAASLTMELQKSAGDELKSAELRGRLDTVRKHSYLIGGIIEAEADGWTLLYKELG